MINLLKSFNQNSIAYLKGILTQTNNYQPTEPFCLNDQLKTSRRHREIWYDKLADFFPRKPFTAKSK